MNLAIDTFPQERFGLVTGSKCSVMFPLRGDGKVGMTTYAKQLAQNRFFQFYDERGSWQTEHGKMAEHWAFIHYQDFYDKNIQPGSWIAKGECGGSTDAICMDAAGGYGIDFKCPVSLEGWLDYMYDGVSKEQHHQCQMYMYLTGLKMWRICAYLIETGFMTENGLTYPIEESKRMIIVYVPIDPDWAEKLQPNLTFVVNKRNEFIEQLKNKFQ
jgi:hypothetical protein